DPLPGTRAILAADLARETWDAGIDRRFRRIWSWMKHEIRAFKENGGVIVNAVSELGITGRPGFVRECASEWGILGLTQAAAKAYAHQRIRINAVAISSAFAAKNAAGSLQQASDAMAWLSASEARFLTGAILPIDGGLSG